MWVKSVDLIKSKHRSNFTFFIRTLSSVQSLDQLVHWRDMRDDSAEILFQTFLQEAHLEQFAGAWTSILWCCPSSISLCRSRIAHPPRCLEGWFWRGFHGVWHARTMQVSVSWQLPEEILVDPHGSWSWSAPSCWSCALSRRYREASSWTWFWKPRFFFSQQAGQGSQKPPFCVYSCNISTNPPFRLLLCAWNPLNPKVKEWKVPLKISLAGEDEQRFSPRRTISYEQFSANTLSKPQWGRQRGHTLCYN